MQPPILAPKKPQKKNEMTQKSSRFARCVTEIYIFVKNHVTHWHLVPAHSNYVGGGKLLIANHLEQSKLSTQSETWNSQ